MPSPEIAWQMLVDWDNDDNFTGDYDDISDRVDIMPGITATRGRDPARSLGEPRIPAMQFVGLNDDRFFSNDYPGSPIYQKATAGRPTRLQWVTGADVAANATVNANDPDTYANGVLSQEVFTGYLDRITHQTGYNERRITGRVLGSLIKLKDRLKASTILYTNISTGDAMGYLLDAVGWPSDKRVISQANVVLKMWWLDREDPYKAAVDLLHTEGPGSYLGEDEFGNIVFEGKDYRPNTSRSLIVQAEFLPDGTGIYFANPEHEDGSADIINVATYRVHNREVQASQAVWRNDGVLTFQPNETKTWDVFADNPFTFLISPLVLGTDWTVSSGGILSATAAHIDAVRIRLTIQATGAGAIIAGLQVRGSPFTGTQLEATNAVDTSDSQDTYGVHARDVSGRGEIDANVAAAICDTTVQRYMAPRAVNHFAIIGYDDQTLSQIFARHVSDRIHYTEPQTGQDIDAFVESKEMRIIDNLVTCVIGCERVAEGTGGIGSYARFDLDVFDVAVFGQ